MGFPNRGEGGGVPDMGKIPTFSSFFLADVPHVMYILWLVQEDDHWTTKTSTGLKTIVLKFKLNEEFDDTTPDGRQVSPLFR